MYGIEKALTDSTPESGVSRSGFTLIELSIVLVIIGLIVGGVLVGRNLIDAAAVRSQISQIEKYQTAVNTFRGKFGYLPGDIPNPDAINFGFTSRGTMQGQGDGNGIVQADCYNIVNGDFIGGYPQGGGETGLFWVDLSIAKLIDNSFNTATYTLTNLSGTIQGTQLNAYAPQAKLNSNSNIYVWSDNGTNYFGLSQISQLIGFGCEGMAFTKSSATVNQAYQIDKKIDDGQPQTGNVTAQFVILYGYWADGDGGPGDTSTATPPTSITCYDDGGSTGTKRQYSVTQNNGAGVNCGLSFRFQ